MNNTITLHEVLQVLDGRDEKNKPNRFDIVFCTFSDTRNTGGERIKMNNAYRIMGKKYDGTKINAKPIPKATLERRNPNHYKNQTRNITVEGSNQIRKLHIRLIEFFNGKKVIW